tara:strand:- start:1678 stop:1935 length:258 start_codon:yes stop_codon:yes gene_type:complete
MLLTHEEVTIIEQFLTSTSSSVTDSFILKVEYTKIAEVIQKVEKLVGKKTEQNGQSFVRIDFNSQDNHDGEVSKRNGEEEVIRSR